MTDAAYDLENPEIIPAATLVVFREAAGAPELLIVERAKAMSFAGGALVFPGGRVDLADLALADPDEGAARIAAIRETLEEAGFAIGFSRQPDAAMLRALRDRSYGGEPMEGLLRAFDLELDLDALVPFARWVPLGRMKRVFDTRFYLARASADAPHAVVDGNENVRLFWASARQVLDLADSGQAHIIYPTRRNLERLARYESFDAARAHAAAHPVRTIIPFIEPRDGADHLCIPDDQGYPVTSEPLETAEQA